MGNFRANPCVGALAHSSSGSGWQVCFEPIIHHTYNANVKPYTHSKRHTPLMHSLKWHNLRKTNLIGDLLGIPFYPIQSSTCRTILIAAPGFGTFSSFNILFSIFYVSAIL